MSMAKVLSYTKMQVRWKQQVDKQNTCHSWVEVICLEKPIVVVSGSSKYMSMHKYIGLRKQKHSQ